MRTTIKAIARVLREYLLPYQMAWILDRSQYKVCLKSRQIGMSYCQALDDVLDAVEGNYDVWVTSTDSIQSKKYIEDVKFWSEVLEQPLSIDTDVQVTRIEFRNSSRSITALSSNPKSLRGKRGKVVVDEFAFHENQSEILKAASACITWGGSINVISTQNHEDTEFYRLLNNKDNGWSKHIIDINTALDQGLLDKIMQRKTTIEDRERWLDNIKNSIGIRAFNQEYLCIPQSDVDSLIKVDKIQTLILPKTFVRYAMGVDVGRTKNPTSVAVLGEDENGAVGLVEVQDFENMGFDEQEDRILEIMRQYNPELLCIDAQGIGMQMAENLERKTAGVIRSDPSRKSEFGMAFIKLVEEGRFAVVDKQDIIRDFSSVYLSKNRVLQKHYKNRHGDRFMACLYAYEALSAVSAMASIISVNWHKRW